MRGSRAREGPRQLEQRLQAGSREVRAEVEAGGCRLCGGGVDARRGALLRGEEAGRLGGVRARVRVRVGVRVRVRVRVRVSSSLSSARESASTSAASGRPPSPLAAAPVSLAVGRSSKRTGQQRVATTGLVGPGRCAHGSCNAPRAKTCVVGSGASSGLAHAGRCWLGLGLG